MIVILFGLMVLVDELGSFDLWSDSIFVIFCLAGPANMCLG